MLIPFGILHGRTNDIAFCTTTTAADVSDLWLETINESGTHYLVDGEWHEIQSRTEVIKVKDAKDVIVTT